jgi:hypothetical protein
MALWVKGVIGMRDFGKALVAKGKSMVGWGGGG